MKRNYVFLMMIIVTSLMFVSCGNKELSYKKKTKIEKMVQNTIKGLPLWNIESLYSYGEYFKYPKKRWVQLYKNDGGRKALYVKKIILQAYKDRLSNMTNEEVVSAEWYSPDEDTLRTLVLTREITMVADYKEFLSVPEAVKWYDLFIYQEFETGRMEVLKVLAKRCSMMESIPFYLNECMRNCEEGQTIVLQEWDKKFGTNIFSKKINNPPCDLSESEIRDAYAKLKIMNGI